MPDSLPELPPPFTLIAPQDVGDAFAHACAVAWRHGAGTLVWARDRGSFEVAVVLEPAEPLVRARLVLFAAMNAVADALAAERPPESSIRFGWPDALLVDGRLVGGGRLGWPPGCADGDVPDWLVFAAHLQDVAEAFDPAPFISGFARHLVTAIDAWGLHGPSGALRQWRRRFAGAGVVNTEGDFVGGRGHSLAEALLAPSWRDPGTGAVRYFY
jgi:hypothetical protein